MNKEARRVSHAFTLKTAALVVLAGLGTGLASSVYWSWRAERERAENAAVYRPPPEKPWNEMSAMEQERSLGYDVLQSWQKMSDSERKKLLDLIGYPLPSKRSKDSSQSSKRRTPNG